MQNAEGGLVSRQPKLALKLHRRHAVRLAGDEVGRPEPNAQRRMAALHDGPDGQSRFATAMAASQNAGTIFEAERFPTDPQWGRRTPRSNGTFPGRRHRPHHQEKAAGTREAIPGMADWRGRERPWSATMYPLYAHDLTRRICGCQPDSAARRPTQDMVGVGVNRIGTGRFSGLFRPATARDRRLRRGSAFRSGARQVARALRLRDRREHDQRVTLGHAGNMFEAGKSSLDFPEAPGRHKDIVVETDGGMIPIVEPDARQKDKRKGKTLSWREAKISLRTPRGAGRQSMPARSGRCRNRRTATSRMRGSSRLRRRFPRSRGRGRSGLDRGSGGSAIRPTRRLFD